MKDKTILKLKKLMELGSKTISHGDKAIRAIEQAQAKVVSDFNSTVMATVRKSEEKIAYHKDIIEQAEGMAL